MSIGTLGNLKIPLGTGIVQNEEGWLLLLKESA
jgi:hypothetical protein